jgi:hypothetical protein
MFFPIKETKEELLALEKAHPVMIPRLRWLQAIKANPAIDTASLVAITNTTEFEMDRWAALYRFGGIDLLVSPKTVLAHSPVKKFSDHAKDSLRELFLHHEGQIGRQLWIEFAQCLNSPAPDAGCITFGDFKAFNAQFKNWRRTDCQTYIQDVIRYAYEKVGRRDVYSGLLAFYRKKGVTGTIMSQYLVSQGWKAYLFMPDTENPDDKNPAHTQKYREALRTKKWWGVPITDFVVNYNPTVGGTVTTPTDPIGIRRLAALANVPFAACVFTEGKHTGILSEGSILEVHWKSISEQNLLNAEYQKFQVQPLYEKTNLLDFDWKEGIFVVPPDTPTIT